MKFRRRSSTTPTGEAGDEAVEATGAEDDTGADEPGTAAEVVDADGTPGTRVFTGPYDAAEVEDDDVARVDLGSLLLVPLENHEVRLQVDESTQEVQAVVIAGDEGAIELRAFAAPRHDPLWEEVRPQIAADMAQRGGTATEQEGRFGTELACALQVTLPDGTTGTQPSRIIGVDGDRWLLRATLLGKPAIDTDAAGPWEEAVAAVAVRRGPDPMPVGSALPILLPDDARRIG